MGTMFIKASAEARRGCWVSPETGVTGGCELPPFLQLLSHLSKPSHPYESTDDVSVCTPPYLHSKYALMSAWNTIPPAEKGVPWRSHLMNLWWVTSHFRFRQNCRALSSCDGVQAPFCGRTFLGFCPGVLNWWEWRCIQLLEGTATSEQFCHLLGSGNLWLSGEAQGRAA